MTAKKTIQILGLFLIGIICLPINAQTFEYYNYSKDLEQKAENGDATSMYYLGRCYRSGRGVDANPLKAIGWFKKAAAKNHAGAMYYLASYYLEGNFVKSDSLAAYKLYERAAELGDEWSALELGSLWNLREIPNCATVALRWLLREVQNGKDESVKGLSAYSLYEKYCGNEGVNKNMVEAVKYLKLAIDFDPMTSYMNELGLCYLNGSGVEQNKAEAIKWFSKGYEQNDAACAGNLGIIYYKEKEYEKAFRYLKEHVEEALFYPIPEAFELLSYCYKNGRGTAVDLAKAQEYYQKSIELRNKEFDE